jgi:hypothetical protein
MILVDLNQVVIANIMMGLTKQNPGEIEISEDILLHMILKSLLTVYRKFKSEYGTMVIAGEGTDIWRKESFPYYKANRKKGRDDTVINWTLIFSVLDTLKEDLATRLPWPVVHTRGAEADDVIAVLTELAANRGEKVMIVSGDRDFVQLHGRGSGHLVKQWDHVKKTMVGGDPVEHLLDKIIRGDTGDGVPNFLSDDDTFVVKEKRQKSITQKMLLAWAGKGRDEICINDTMRKNWDRNVKMMDLTQVPQRLVEEIEHKYNQQSAKRVTLVEVTGYLMEKRMRKLMEDVQDFK